MTRQVSETDNEWHDVRRRVLLVLAVVSLTARGSPSLTPSPSPSLASADPSPTPTAQATPSDPPPTPRPSPDPADVPTIARPYVLGWMTSDSRATTGPDGSERVDVADAYVVGRRGRHDGIHAFLVVTRVIGAGDPVTDLVATANAEGYRTWTKRVGGVKVRLARTPSVWGSGVMKVSAGWKDRASGRWMVLVDVMPEEIDAILKALLGR